MRLLCGNYAIILLSPTLSAKNATNNLRKTWAYCGRVGEECYNNFNSK